MIDFKPALEATRRWQLREDPRFLRADALDWRLRKLVPALGARVLGKYRLWLDRHGIHAEDDGWPSEEVYDEVNIQAWVRDVTEPGEGEGD